MSKKFYNQSGFAATTILLFVALLVIIGGAAWFVLKSNKNTKTSNTTSTQTTTNPATSSQKAAVKDPYDGWKQYCSEAEKSCFKYPNDWVLTSEADTEFAPGTVKITSTSSTVVSWRAAIGGIGGGCDEATDPHIYFNAVTPMPNVAGFYLIELGKKDAGTTNFAVMDLTPDKAKVGDTGDCIVFGFFTSKYSTYNGVKGKSGLQVDVSKSSDTDKETARKILQSYTYDI